MLSKEEKMGFVVNKLRSVNDPYALIFCNTQFQTHSVAEWLKAMGFKSMPISGRLPQNKRTKLMADFRSREVTILVCTDVAARGLDIKDVELVINYDLPQEAANYVHRIGRTGRAGSNGEAISLCAYEDCENLDDIYKLIGDSIPKIELTDDHFAKDLCRKPYIDAKTLKVVSRDYSSRKHEQKSSRNSTKNDKKYDRRNERTEKMKESRTRESRDNKRENMPMNSEKKANQSQKREPRINRFFEITSSSYVKAADAALNHFNMKDDKNLGFEEVEKGRKMFFFFGPAKTKYRFFYNPKFVEVLTPFLREILLLANLDLTVSVEFKNPNLNINFDGKDAGLLLTRNEDLLKAFDTIVRVFIIHKLGMQKYRLNVRVLNRKNERSNNGKNQDSRNRDRNKDRNKDRSKELHKLAKKLREDLIKSKTPVTFKSLSPSDRRIVHQYFQDDEEVKTNSIGKGRFKKIELSLK